MDSLVEVDSLEVTVIVDNELDPMSPAPPDTVQVIGGPLPLVAMQTGKRIVQGERGSADNTVVEIPLDHLCCSAHGLSLMVTAAKDDTKRTILFDTGPEEDVWERNAHRLGVDLSKVDVIQLSHWHRDHSGGMLRAIRMIKEAKEKNGDCSDHDIIVDLHPDRPDYRGFVFGDKVISLEADPTFDEITAAGATVQKHNQAHTVLDDMFLISGEIPRTTSYETGLQSAVRYIKEDNEWISDEKIADERLLACKVKDKGLVVFTGCSHAGVVNTTRHAIDLVGGKVPVYAVVGGFHLSMSDESVVESTVRDLWRLDPAVLVPGHCTGWRAKFAIERKMNGQMFPCSVGTRFVI